LLRNLLHELFDSTALVIAMLEVYYSDAMYHVACE